MAAARGQALPASSPGAVRAGDHRPPGARLRHRAVSPALRRPLHRPARTLRAAHDRLPHLRHRPARPRPCRPAVHGGPHLAARRLRRHADVHRLRQPDRHRRRLLRRQDRRGADAFRRRDAVLSEHLPAARAGRLHQAEPDHDHADHRRDELDGDHADRRGRDQVAAGTGLHHGGEDAGPLQQPDHVPRAAAERHRADHRRGDAHRRPGDPARSLCQLPRLRHPAAAAELGQHAQRGAAISGFGAVAGDRPGRRHHAGRHRLQLRRRRPARRPRRPQRHRVTRDHTEGETSP
ncbi:binding-protein-dependent transporter system inner membrane protein [Aurantimonas sp. 22II-16-19i]|nr:binding-protein-dependent transporter system inner membrane protein [Aurantimonas sp. 22II-16-19i]